VLIDAEGVNLIDSTATEMLLKLQTRLHKKGITLTFAHVHNRVKDKMAIAGVVDSVGADHFYNTLHDGIEAFENNNQGIKK